MKKPWIKRALPWAFYDWANSAFATTVMAWLVSAFNHDYWSMESADSSWRLGLANSPAGILVALLIPVTIRRDEAPSGPRSTRFRNDPSQYAVLSARIRS